MTWSAGLALSVLFGGSLFNRLAPRGKMLLLGGRWLGLGLANPNPNPQPKPEP